MTDSGHSLARLIQQAAPEPPTGLDFNALRTRVQRRRTRSAIVECVGAAVAVGAVVGVAVQVQRDPVAGGIGPIATGNSAPTPSGERSACPPTRPHANGLHVDVDYVPFIVLGGKALIARLDEVPPLTRSELGPMVGTVSCRIADLTQNSRMGVVGKFPDDYLDGNAAYLKVGTPIWSVQGFDPTCRVAVVEDGKVVPYLAHHEVDRHSVAMDCAITPARLTASEIRLANRIANQQRREVVGTFVGATAFPTTGAPFDPDSGCDMMKRYINIRLVWEADANFTHSHMPGAAPDGPRKAALVTVDPATHAICESGAMYRDVGAKDSETLLFGEWPDPADG